jgi:hypothetical protein
MDLFCKIMILKGWVRIRGRGGLRPGFEFSGCSQSSDVSFVMIENMTFDGSARPILVLRFLLLSCLLLVLPSVQGQVSQPPATILIVRHAEKLTDGRLDLSPVGFKRAALLPDLFVPAGVRSDLPLPQVLIATGQSAHSNRPVETITPLAAALNLPIDSSVLNEDYGALAASLLSGRYAGKVVLVSWHHGKIPALATALGAKVPYAVWPEGQFDRVWRIDYVGGKAVLKDLPQRLMPGDSN